MASASASTRARTSGRTSCGRLKTFEAVAFETPARSATSLSFAFLPVSRPILLPAAAQVLGVACFLNRFKFFLDVSRMWRMF